MRGYFAHKNLTTDTGYTTNSGSMFSISHRQVYMRPNTNLGGAFRNTEYQIIGSSSYKKKALRSSIIREEDKDSTIEMPKRKQGRSTLKHLQLGHHKAVLILTKAISYK